ncbi:MAG: glycosyltransferase family 39 protein [Chitinophagaceae bacterium]|nr:glycosyltransferase family 39 protein [Chitinophagaceae bacterium]
MYNKTLILLFFIAAKFILQYLIIDPSYDLQRDEYLHLDQAQHLSAGFLSVPPVTSWIAFLINAFGNTFFWIKFFPALFGALTILVVWKITEELKGGIFAQALSATALLFSILPRINMLFQPNSLDILLWTVVYFCLIKYVNTNLDKWVLWLAVFIAVGILNKYNILFLMAGLFPAMLITKRRILFSNRIVYLSMLLALLLILPNLIWQMQHHFPVVYHMKELAKTQLVNIDRKDFIIQQVLFFISSLPVLIAGYLSFIFYKPCKKYGFILLSFIFTLLIFIYFKAKGYYAIGLYPVIIGFGSVYIEKLLSAGWKKNVLRPALVVSILVLFMIPFKAIYPVLSPQLIAQNAQLFKKYGLLKWEDGKDHTLPQDFADMLGWKELSEKVVNTYNALPDKNTVLIFCDNYGQAGAINYYAKGKIPKAVSFNADYIFWFPKEMTYKNLIHVKEAGDSIAEAEKHFFKSISVGGIIENIYAREYGTTIFVLVDADSSFTTFLHAKIEERIKSYSSY